jgi:hypothetical protein
MSNDIVPTLMVVCHSFYIIVTRKISNFYRFIGITMLIDSDFQSTSKSLSMSNWQQFTFASCN